MSTVGNAFNRAGLPGAVGVEIEYEGYNQRQDYRMEWWNTTRDGSLRNGGVEFVSIPLSNSGAVDRAFAELELLRRTAFTAQPSFRCGVHVHMDVTNMEMRQFLAFCTYYAIVEPALMEQCGEERQDNVFCVPWYHTPRQVVRPLGDAYLALAKPQSKMGMRTLARAMLVGLNKYQAMNLLPIQTQGTVELRMAPTWEALGDIKRWVELCMDLRRASMAYDCPEAVLDTDPQELYERIDLVYDSNRPYTEDAMAVAAGIAGDSDAEMDWSLPNIVLAAPTEPPAARPRRRRDNRPMHIDEHIERVRELMRAQGMVLGGDEAVVEDEHDYEDYDIDEELDNDF